MPPPPPPPNPPGRRRTQGVLKRVSPTETQFTKFCRSQRQVAEEEKHSRANRSSSFSNLFSFVFRSVPHLGGNSQDLSSSITSSSSTSYSSSSSSSSSSTTVHRRGQAPQARLNRLRSSPCRVSSPFVGGPATTGNPRSPPIPSDCSLSRWRRSFTRRSPRLEGALVFHR